LPERSGKPTFFKKRVFRGKSDKDFGIYYTSGDQDLPAHSVRLGGLQHDIRCFVSAKSRGPFHERSMKVSVIVNTYQRERLLVQSLAAILRNDHEDFELILVDQNVGNSTRCAVETTFPRDPRLRYVHSAKVGIAAGRNLGLSLAKGELILFTDDDGVVGDRWIASHVRCHARLRQRGVTPGVVGGPSEVMWESPTPPWWPDEFLYILCEFGLEPDRSAFVGGELPPGLNYSCARDLLEKVGGFDERLGYVANRPSLFTVAGCDSEVALRLHRMGCHVHFCREALVRHVAVSARLTRSAFAMRLFREGATQTLIDRFAPGTQTSGIADTVLRNLARAVRSLFRVLVGCPLTGESLFGKHAAKELGHSLVAAGRIWGLALLVFLRNRPRRGAVNP
jgi:GT2 family glycosyltransferase